MLRIVEKSRELYIGTKKKYKYYNLVLTEISLHFL